VNVQFPSCPVSHLIQQRRRLSVWRLVVAGLALAACSWAHAAGPTRLDEIDLQLRWHHQFQFAGYYAALEQGYYRAAGLDVRIHEGAPGRTPVGEVLAGRAQYGEANSELLYQRLKGEPLVALAAVFQHSPSVLLARADSRIRSPQDLAGKRVMIIGDVTDADLIAMLQNEGVDLNRVNMIPSSYQIHDLVDGKVDAFNSYLTNEPYYLRQHGVEYTVLDPRRYGIDFYSDILFTTEQEVHDHPERVHAFRQASLRGWEYAMAHPEEIIDLLQRKYGVTKTRDHLAYEASSMRQLIQPDLVQIGHMNPGRWQHMADTLVKIGMLQPGYSLDGFLYDTDRTAELTELKRITALSLAAAAVLGVLVAVFAVLYRRLRREIHRREAAEAEIRRLAYHDSLTGLPNRNLFYDRFEQAIRHAERENGGFALCFIDLDGFKHINDRYGHVNGDRLLNAVARRLEDAVRSSDTVARFGGDEFVVLLQEVDDRSAAQQLADMLLQTIRQPYILDQQNMLISSSIGVTLYPSDEQDIKKLLHYADSAMYRGKQQGKDRLVFHHDATPL
jgi:diguanylate cyclase (GGDEF)-like protein